MIIRQITGQLAALVLFSGAASAALPPVVDGNAQQVSGAASSNLLTMYKRLEQLQQDVQQMRGQLEEQNYLIESLKKNQRDLYLDTDRRIQQLEAPVIQQAVLPVIQPEGADMLPKANLNAASTALGADKKAYDKAFAGLQAGRYPQAISDFSAFVSSYPTSEYLANAYYWLAEASYVSRDFSRALDEFNQVLQQFPRHAKAKDALLKIGFIHYENKQWQQARASLQRVTTDYPSTTVASLAAKRLERMRQEQH
ncbi:MAG: tol-pal system protein YbgF [Cycloclasticus sp.]